MELPCAPDFPIRTERLMLRPFVREDLEPLLAVQSDPVAVRYVPYPPRDRPAVVAVLDRKIANTALRREGDLIELAVALVEGGDMIGDVLLALRSVEHE